MTQEDLAGLLYDSLYNKILPLANDVTVYPAHGAGSACGKNMMKETVDTLGNQKSMNYALNQPSKEAFVAAVTDGLLPPPAYFPMNVAMNKKGYDSFESVKSKGLKAIEVNQFEAVAETAGALMLDTRSSAEFAVGYVPNSINIGLDGSFAPWVGDMIRDVKQPIILITDEGKEEETLTRLARVGFDNILGYLKGGVEAWKNAGKEVDTVNRITPEQFATEYKEGVSDVIDLRKESEYLAEHVNEAENKPLSFINEWAGNLDADKTYYLHCAGGYRSMIASSILQARGIRNFKEVAGGFDAIAKTTVAKSDFVCQSKLLKV